MEIFFRSLTQLVTRQRNMGYVCYAFKSSKSACYIFSAIVVVFRYVLLVVD